MPKYDPIMKRLGRLRPEDFIEWLCPNIDAQEVTFEDREFELTQRRVDLLYKVKTETIGEFLLHLEFQGAWEKDFSIRLHEYSTRIRREFEYPVKTVAIFLDSSSTIREAEPIDKCELAGEFISEFQYTKIILPDEQWKEILSKKIPALLSLIPLTKIPKGQEKEALSEATNSIGEIEDKELRGELAAVLYLIGGYRYSGTIEKILGEKLMQDLMESKTYRETFEKGEKTGELKRAQKDILEVLEIRFGSIPKEIISRIDTIADDEKLSELHKKAVVIETLKEFQKLL